ncbi:MAG: proteasome accessory factor PafA2 family protein, partial [Nitrospirota bacterium]
KDPMLLSREIDWIIKKELLLSYMEKKGVNWNDSRIAMMDLQYHDIREDKGLYYALEKDGYVERVVSASDIAVGEESPPADTRAYFRGMCLKKFPKDIYAASWSSILFEAGDSTIKRVPLMEPLKGTEALTKGIIEGSSTIEELLARLAT